MTTEPHRQGGPTAPAGQHPADRGGDRFARVLLALALALGLLRFLWLGRWSLWLDEALTLADSLHRSGLKNPAGYWLFGQLYELVPVRPDELLLRLPAALCGFLAIPLAALVLRPWIGARAAAAAALLLAASPWGLYWSQVARFYTLAQLLGLAGAGLVLRGLLRGSTAAVLGGLAATGCAALVHPSAVLLFGAVLVAPWIARRLGLDLEVPVTRAWRVHLACGALALLLGAGWTTAVWHMWSSRAGAGSMLHFVRSTGYLVTPLFCLGVLLGAWEALRARDGRATLVVLIAVSGTLAALAASFFVRVSAQYVFVLLPWYAAAAAAPIARWELRQRGNVRAALYVALLCTPALAETGLYFGWRNGDRPMWREAFRLVLESRRDDDLVLAMEAPVGEYYLEPRKTDLRAWRQVTFLDNWRSHLADDWARHPRRTWFVVNEEQLKDWSREDRRRMEEVLEGQCRLVQSFEIPFTPRDLDVKVYLRE